ncbi:hypothetical protein PF005_g359 [Phytophthora fragariae]|uniref:Uncharacterized protein n=1 Tax=Phytophthora fragariae TaxID=53985 RepID=A0A6A3LY25_9STRA|nr:hypothetical protein PF003_g9764 [Phytophthora fragariae]KAE8950080.1 hypothetical protein PF009_g402 [Phytophthora fragariae]KAE9022735.1 hypothetical protein PF011_g4304 [Phytophthora fragariae]KAE9139429.1 hypothetical protein PF007_g996 [Phytophthora fragariae]KAE9139992.1 hypothetical protein PF010_g393 [Phytophthora fragariae]
MSSTPHYYTEKVHTPVAEGAHYNDETALRLDVSASGAENKKDDGELGVPMDKNGRPLVKFLKWRMTRKHLVVILLAVILLVVLLAVIPAVIQHYINSVDLTINYLDVKGVPSDSTLTVELNLNVQHDIAISTSTEDITASHGEDLQLAH